MIPHLTRLKAAVEKEEEVVVVVVVEVFLGAMMGDEALLCVFMASTISSWHV